MIIDELDELLHPETLPLFKFGRQAHYEGSIDKKGGNADWDWELYRQPNGESVLFEQYGPGCICNFVQHRYLAAAEPTFRFYFDGEKQPRFTLKPSQFGEKYPFLSPLADKFIGPERDGQVIRVVRSFLPMPFTSSCKITSDIPLFGNAGYGGGWGHVVYHTYSGCTPAKSFDPADRRYRQLAALWKECENGRSPLRPKAGERWTLPAFDLTPGEEKILFAKETPAMVTSLRLTAKKAPPETLRQWLSDVWVKITFDGHGEPDIFLPMGCFFGNELGHHAVNSLFTAADGEGRFRFSFPMPYGESVTVSLQNRGQSEANFDGGAVETTEEYAKLFSPENFGYLMSAPYYPKAHTHAADSVIADFTGIHGHVISSTITGYQGKSGWADCEGDVRIHFDGIRTPQIESDGSESYACYGWGFCSPPQSCPVSFYDGKDPDIHTDWSMTRHLPLDVYPFHDGLHFGIESFGHNNENLEMFHSGAVLFYGRRESHLLPLLRFTEGEERMTAFFEGDDDHIPFTKQGTRGMPIEFTVEFPAGIRELVLRRVSDQTEGRQMAKVSVNGRELPLPWYAPDRNPYKQWLEDEYILGENLLTAEELAGGRLTVRIEPQAAGGKVSFNQFGMAVYGRRW